MAPHADDNHASSSSSLHMKDRYDGIIATKLVASNESIRAEDIPRVVKRLRDTFYSERTLSREWRLEQLRALLRLMTEGRDELRKAMKADIGKSPLEGDITEIDLVVSEIHNAIEHLDEWMAPHYTKSSALNFPSVSATQADPLGVVLIMGAWNYPIQLTFAPLVGAIAAGNCAVIKPGSYAVTSSHTIAHLVKKYMDPECFVVAEGNRDVTNALLEQRFDKIFFTGSAYVGRLIAVAAAKNLTPVVLELGGKSPAIVDKSADINMAARRIVWGAFLNSGQTCVRPDFALVHKDVADAFFREVKAAVKEFYSENPNETEWFGRIINEKAFDRLEELIKKEKSKIIAGQGRSDRSQKYIEPAVFDYGSDLDAFASSPLMDDEIFGPLLPCCRFSDIDEVVDFTRRLKTGKPLAMYCFAEDQAVRDTISRRTTSGGLLHGDCLMHLANHELPFGGVGESGMGGGYHGERSFWQFSHEKAILTKYAWLDQSPILKPLLDARFPPYTPFKKALLAAFSDHRVSKILAFEFPILRKILAVLIAYKVFTMLGFKITRA